MRALRYECAVFFFVFARFFFGGADAAAVLLEEVLVVAATGVLDALGRVPIGSDPQRAMPTTFGDSRPA
jgi:hypothetical protein